MAANGGSAGGAHGANGTGFTPHTVRGDGQGQVLARAQGAASRTPGTCGVQPKRLGGLEKTTGLGAALGRSNMFGTFLYTGHSDARRHKDDAGAQDDGRPAGREGSARDTTTSSRGTEAARPDASPKHTPKKRPAESAVLRAAAAASAAPHSPSTSHKRRMLEDSPAPQRTEDRANGKEAQDPLPVSVPADTKQDDGGDDDDVQIVAETGNVAEKTEEELLRMPVLERCQWVHARIMSGALGSKAGGDDEAALLTLGELEDACGEQAGRLKPYQVVGVSFLSLLHRYRIPASIVADEMGLGKTCQVLTFLNYIEAVERDQSPHLVVVPVSLIDNWNNEVRMWCPDFRVETLHGAGLQDAKAALEDARVATKRLRKLQAQRGDPAGAAAPPPSPEDEFDCGFDILLCPYSVFERDTAAAKGSREALRRVAWSHVVLDEAHAVKNRNSARSKKLKTVTDLCRRRILLSGTPLQNSLDELHALVELILPDVRGVSLTDLLREHRHLPSAPTAKAADDAAPVIDLAGDDDDDDGMDRGPVPDPPQEIEDPDEAELVAGVRRLLAPLMLRRMKADVAGQLCAKEQVVSEVEMVPRQAALYGQEMERVREQVRGAGGAGRGRGRGEAELLKDGGVGAESIIAQLGRKKISNLFVHLRKISYHPLLVRNRYTDATVEEMTKLCYSRGVFGSEATLEMVREELMKRSDIQLHGLCEEQPHLLGKFALPDEAWAESGKIEHLTKLLAELRRTGSRPLIFSNWTTVLDILERVLRQLNYSFVRLDGSTGIAERQSLVDRFNSNPPPPLDPDGGAPPDADGEGGVFAFLLSTRAGGQGLNLTGADTVILHDVDFNPQADRQAEDRAHRLGQERTVKVHRLVTKGTVDARIHERSQRKAELGQAVLADGQEGAAGGAARDERDNTRMMGEILMDLVNGDES
ncbi:unnamed protein product [Pedinophyceae sp. YPF-701]|nr:unnamed protein product [Pedinophyceae sp. YPF-701]